MAPSATAPQMHVKLKTRIQQSWQSLILGIQTWTQAIKAKLKSWFQSLVVFCTDTWAPEIAAVFLCISSCAVIGGLLKKWSDREIPQLSGNFTVNAIVSIFATTSKTAMLFAISSCIAQNKWIWFQNRPKPLSHAQIYDDASRGPYGATLFLLSRTFFSIASLGACITILALGFDPFVQQAVSYPLSAVNISSSDVSIQRAIRIDDAVAANPNELITNAIELKAPDLQLVCPSGNCTWSNFETVSLCHKCESRSLSFTQPWSWSLLRADQPSDSNDTNGVDYNNDMVLTAYSGELQEFNVTLARSNTASYGGNSSEMGGDFETVVSATWDLTLFSNTNTTLSASGLSYWNTFQELPISLVLGLQNPYYVLGFPFIDWDADGPIVRNFTVCAMEPCLKEYAVSVVNNQASYTHVESTLGQISVQNITLENSTTFEAICWQPNGREPPDKYDVYETSLPSPAAICPYDNSGGGYCSCSEISSTSLEYLLTGGLTGEAKWGGDFSYNPFNKTYTVNSTLIKPPDYWGLLTYDPYGSNTNAFFNELVVEHGPEEAMSSLSKACDLAVLASGSLNVTGKIVTMLPHVQVQWWWLFLPALLNFLAAIFLVLTMILTSRSATPLWKTSLMAAYYHGLAPALQNDVDRASRNVSDMDSNSELVQVRLLNSQRGEDIVFEKGNNQ